MTAIITERFRQHNATQFFESFSEASGNSYYLFIGKATPFTTGTSGGSDGAPPTPVDGISEEFYVWDDMIAAKQITGSFISYAIPRRDFANGTIYDMYDHAVSSSNVTTSGATNIYDSSFFFLTADYRVYQILDNNGGVAFSGSAPTSESTAPFESGGYVLQYMYSLTSSEVEKYLTTDFMPVSTDTAVSSAAVDGSIVSLKVTGGSGYSDGTYYAAIYGDGTSQGTSSGGIVRVTVVSGAVASFGLTAGTDTTIHAIGSGYTYGKVNLASGYTFSDTSLSTASAMGGTGGVVEVVISPKGGHGYNAVEQLGGHYLMMNTTLTQSEGDDFTTANDFRRVGVVVDPYIYGTSTLSTASTVRQTYALNLTTLSGTFDIDEKISQETTGAIGKVVDWDSSLNILYYQQERFGDYGTNGSTGSYVAFSGANKVTGSTSNAYGTPDAASDSAVTLAGGATMSFTNGYANPELQPDSGNIIYIENRKPISRSSDQTEDIKLIVEF